MGRFTKEYGRRYTTPQPQIPGFTSVHESISVPTHYSRLNDELHVKFKEYCDTLNIVLDDDCCEEVILTREQYIRLRNSGEIDADNQIPGRTVFRMIIYKSEILIHYLVVKDYSCTWVESHVLYKHTKQK